MLHTLTICDERPTGDILRHLELAIDRERLTVADLIHARVTAEVDTYNRRLSGLFHGLVQPTASEQTLNGYRMRSRTPIDAAEQVCQALEAFQRNRFFVLVDNRQVETLEETILVSDDTRVSFVKLLPLVGG